MTEQRDAAADLNYLDAVDADWMKDFGFTPDSTPFARHWIQRAIAAERELAKVQHEKEDMRQRNQFLRTRPDLTVEDLRRRMERFGVLDRLDAAERERDDLRGVLTQTWNHLNELREAFCSGALRSCDGNNGLRSQRNVDVEVAVRQALSPPAQGVNR